MRKAWISCGVLLLAGAMAVAVDLSGEWASQLTFGSAAVSARTTFTLHLAGSGWQLTSSWNPVLPEVSSHTLVLRGGLGALTWTAGASFDLAPRGGGLPLSRAHGQALWAAEGFAVRSGFVSFDLVLGNLTLRLTLHGAPAE